MPHAFIWSLQSVHIFLLLKLVAFVNWAPLYATSAFSHLAALICTVPAVQNERQPRNSAQVRQEQIEAELDNPLLSSNATVSATHPAFVPSSHHAAAAAAAAVAQQQQQQRYMQAAALAAADIAAQAAAAAKHERLEQEEQGMLNRGNNGQHLLTASKQLVRDWTCFKGLV